MHRPMQARYLLVGAGVAGSSAAEAIRSLDPAGSIVLVGQEVVRPYHRPPLSKSFLRGETGRGDLLTHPIGWFREQDVQLLTGRRASALELDRQRLALDDGTVIQYEQCLLCYGAMVAPLEVPGAGLPGLYYLRTLADAEALATRVAQALRDGRPHPHGRGRATVIGAGLLGLELAASLRTRGLWIELAHDAPLPWPSYAGEAAGRFLAGLLQRHDVVVHASNPPVELQGDGRVQRVRLAGGETIQCDFAVACVGVQVDRRPVQNTNIPMGRVIACDAYGRTGVEQGVQHVWAAGDCAGIHDARFGKHLREGHAHIARAAGTLVGRNMAHALAGRPLEAWTEVPAWDSEAFGVRFAGWGLPRLIERRIVRGSVAVDAADFAEIGIDAGGRVCHVLAVGREAEHEALRRLVEARAEVSGREEALRDPTTPV